MSADLIERLREYAKDWRERAADKSIVDEAADALAAKDTALSEMRAELETERHALGHEIRIKSEAIADYRREKAVREAAEAQLERARKALEPFLDMAREMLSRGWNAGNIVIALDNPSDPHSIDAGHFFALLASQDEGEER